MATTPSVDYRRGAGLCDPDRAAATHVTVVGVGTVGSHVADQCCRQGVGEITLYDHDVVAPENLPSQRYALDDVGSPKVAALARRLHAVSDRVRVNAHQVALNGGERLPGGPVVLAVDSMRARREILELSVAHRHPLAIEARIGGTEIQVFALDPHNDDQLDLWRDHYWFPDEQAEPLPCGMQAASEVGARCGALIAAIVRRHLMGLAVPFLHAENLDTFEQTVIGPLGGQESSA